MVEAIVLAGRRVGPGAPVFVIAEAGVNHNGSVALALQLVDAAADAGADAVKFQTFRADTLATGAAPKAEYQERSGPPGESQRDMLRRLELSPDAHRRLIERCASRNITFLSTPFDEESVDLLDSLDVPLFKIPSGEVTNLPFLEHVARKGRPVILSTGMATLKEVEAAVAALAGVGPLVLLHCVSTYPADPADVNLRAMHTLAETFDVPVGYSDHTIGNDVPLAAVALGACVVEKHLTLDRAMAGPDHSASAEPSELRALVRGIRSVEKALGHGRKEAVPAEAMTAAVARRTLVAACDIPPGTAITGDMLLARRAGGGLAPGFRQHVVGKLATRAIPEGAVIELDMFQ